MTFDSLTPLDIASGMVLPSRHRPRAPRSFDGEPASPRDALDREILPALLRPPCLVSFSGGRDSAAVLAAATSLARREGLPLPIPATNVVPSAAGADESCWQEMAVRHLGLTEWLRLEHDDELDLIGPHARRVLAAHGLLWPANVHFHLPLLEAGRGGSMLTGIGGDELYTAARRLHHAAVLSGAVRARPRDLLSLGLAFAPRPVRNAAIAARSSVEAPWLRERARTQIVAVLAAEAAAEPRRLPDRLAWWQTIRYLHVGVESLALIAGDTSTLIAHPLLSPRLWHAAAAAAAPVGFASRTAGVRTLFGDLLPPAIIERDSKANFDEVFWTERSRAFVRGWDGSGVPTEWVDADELARHWAGANPSVPSSLLLQAAWLCSGRDRVEQPGERILH